MPKEIIPLTKNCNSKMTFQTFISKLNLRQIIVYFLANCFFSYVFLSFSYLHAVKLMEVAGKSDDSIYDTTFIENNISGNTLSDFLLWNTLAPLCGLLISFIIALIISKKRRWSWVNSLLSFIIFYILWINDFAGWNYLKSMLMSPGKIFKNPVLEYFSNGLLLLIAGFLLFYLMYVTEFFQSKKLSKAVALKP